MNVNHHPKSSRFPDCSPHAIRGGQGAGVLHRRILPARRVMICLGWLRLYQTILSNKTDVHDASGLLD
jgi:hypothetical protein